NANPRAAPSDPAAIDFFLRGRHEYRKFWPDPVRASIELFDKALALAPSDPVILSSAALARARLAFFSGEGLAEAVALSERAVALAPNLGEARLARGNVVFQLGDTAAALRELKMAIARSPGLAEAHASLGRILIELGDLDEGVRRLETALELDSHVPLAATALARVFAITGDWHRVEAMALLSAVTDGVASSHTLRARLALWKRDIEAARATLLQIEDMGLQALVSVALLELVVRRKVPDFLTLVPQNHGRPQTLPGASNAATLRRNTFFMQITAETQMFLGDREAAVAALANAVDNALIDLLWLERCPLWDDELRAMPLYQSSLARMRRRCADLLDAYRAS
ncbi:MAG TPA: tetratricopeptide repeat protein, partial [Byssovorax sp.]